VHPLEQPAANIASKQKGQGLPTHLIFILMARPLVEQSPLKAI
jgi:hypothetical protein